MQNRVAAAFISAIGFALALSMVVPATVRADTLRGELVVIGSSQRFRIVGHEGRTFAAPAGTDIEALDGKNVIVDVSSNGHVESITPNPIHVDQVTDTEMVAQGELKVVDPTAGVFTLAGDTQTYVAPAGVDVGLYAGRFVRIRTHRGKVENIQLASAPPVPPPPAPAAAGRPEPQVNMMEGQLVARDAALRTFSLAGLPGVYVAPEGVDVGLYDGHWVRVDVSDGRVSNIILARQPSAGHSTAE